MRRKRVQLPAGTAVRADRLLAAELPDLSRRALLRWIEDGSVRIDGRRVKKGQWLRGERALDIEAPEAPEVAIAAEPEPAVPVLYEDARCVALDKPAGRPGHALRAGERGTVAGFLASRYPECLAAGSTPLEAGLVHRLDTDTSGVLLAARDAEAWGALRAEFRAGRVEKRYLALVAGDVAAPGVVERALDDHDRRRVRVLAPGAASAAARAAITRYRPLRRSPSATLLEVEIPTGVRHQIRAHLAAIGHPLLGDALYGGARVPEGRHLLHAARVVFGSPGAGARIAVESPLPDDFRAALRRLGLERP